jgi:chorismate mutase
MSPADAVALGALRSEIEVVDAALMDAIARRVQVEG